MSFLISFFSYAILVVEAREGFCRSKERLNPMNDPAGVHRGSFALGVRIRSLISIHLRMDRERE